MCHDRNRSTLRLDTTSEIDGHLDRMHGHHQSVQSVESRIWLGHFLEHAPDNSSLRLKLIPIGLSLWFTSFWIVIPTMSLSLTYYNACSNRSFTLAWKWLTGLAASGGGCSLTVSWVPTALKRLYCLLISPFISNLRSITLHNIYIYIDLSRK